MKEDNLSNLFYNGIYQSFQQPQGCFYFCYKDNQFRFTTLNLEQRKKLTQISDDIIVEMAIILTGIINQSNTKVSIDFSKQKKDLELDDRFKVRMFTTRNVSTAKIEAEKFLIDNIRVVCIGRPAIYFCETFLEDPSKYLNCLSQISQHQIFKYQQNRSNSKRYNNPLWFSCHAFNSLSEWICSSLEQIMIVKYEQSVTYPRQSLFIESQTPILEFVEQFLKFCQNRKSNNLNQSKIQNLQKWLKLSILQSCCQEVLAARKIFRKLQNQFNDYKTKQLWDTIDIINTTTGNNKKSKKVQKKKKSEKKLKQTIKQDIIIETEKQIPHEQSSISSYLVEDCALTKDTSATQLKQTFQQIIQNVNLNSQIVNIKEQFPEIQLSDKEQHMVDDKQYQDDRENTNLIVEELNNEHAISHSTSDSLEHKKKRRQNNKKPKRRVPEQLVDHIYNEWFETSLQSFVDNLSIQSNKLFEARIIVFERIRNFVMKLYGQYTVDAHLFGSCSVGLALSTSDIDILLTGFNLQSQSDCAQLLEKLSSQLKKMKWIVQCSIYPSAKVPIIKVSVNPNIPFLSTYAPGSEDFQNIKTIGQNLQISKPVDQLIHIDITVEVKQAEYGHMGFKSTQFMKSNLQQNQYLHPIVLTLKYLLSQKRLNKPYKGGLSSFGLLILCSAFLKTYSNYTSVSTCFINLLDFYARSFNGQKQSITLYQNSPCFTQRSLMQSPTESELSIIDPLNGRVMTANCTGFYLIKYQFRRVFNAITKIKQVLKSQLKELDVNQFKHLKQGKKKYRDKFIRRYLQTYQIKEMLNSEE